MGNQMPTVRENKRVVLERAAKVVTATRARWLKQLLNWPLEDGLLANRLTKAEIAALGKAAKQGKLFC
jgi:hypothetical protein